MSGEWEGDRGGGKDSGEFRGYSEILAKDDGGPDHRNGGGGGEEPMD